ncbi:caspase-14-like [Sabethes cyaneus]|uniref:caspase-14-like n=1 Tax=Sabethes cyaneus TaxID=53552 RepID=UPI00237D5EBB|nr:caspase-14-like [Sabethes cyaneus]
MAQIARYDLSRGCHVLIFNHKKFKNELNERKGSEKDLELLKIFFNNYQVNELEIYSDFSVEQVKTKMAEIEKKDFKECSCLIVIIMSHGGLGDTIMASDEQSYNLETDIVDRVLDNSTLKDKPKLFFIQACRGNALMETDSFPSVSNKNDIWKLHSTYEGTVSFRDIERGTCFVQTLFDFIETNNDKSLHEISLLLRAEFKNHE